MGSDAAWWKLGQGDGWRGGPLTRNPRYWKKEETLDSWGKLEHMPASFGALGSQRLQG